LIYDLGGGTFDLSLVRFDQTQLRVLATAGHLKLGGLDWDQRLLDQFVKSFKMMHDVDLAEPRNHKSLRRLSREIENSKRRLSDPEIPETDLFFQYKGLEAEYRVNRKDFERVTADLVNRTRALADELVKAAGVGWDEIDAIIPVGGATRMPMIGRLIESFSNRGPRIHSLSPDFAVSMGAALFAGMREGEKNLASQKNQQQHKTLAAFNTAVVSTRTLGILVSNDKGQRVVQPVIPRNTPLPVVARLAVTTTRPGQSRVSLKIVESDADGQSVLCVCRIRDLPPDLPAGSLFEVELTYDAQGLLHLVARHRASGRLAAITAQYQAGTPDGTGESPPEAVCPLGAEESSGGGT
jgi:molecular chaperone DnaK